MAKKTYFLDEDIQFHFKNTINWKKIVPLYEDLNGNFKLTQAINMYHDTLKELGTIAANELEETAKESDEIGVRFENGDIKDELNYKQGVKDGPSKTWFQGKVLHKEGAYSKGKREGTWKLYHPETHHLWKSATFRGGVLDGPCAVYDPMTADEKPVSAGKFANGTLQ